MNVFNTSLYAVSPVSGSDASTLSPASIVSDSFIVNHKHLPNMENHLATNINTFLDYYTIEPKAL